MMTFEQTLSLVQALVLLYIILLTSPSPTERALLPPLSTMLQRWTHRLWSTAPRNLPESLSPWRAWLLAESVRRTLLASFLVRCTDSLLTCGYFIASAFCQALPLDARRGLWTADGDEEWEVLCLESGETNDLMSLNELGRECTAGRKAPWEVDDFGQLLLVMSVRDRGGCDHVEKVSSSFQETM